ncbi:MAG: hypothetical protein ACRBCS_02150 [Cellvibrionaceae bacterium]
MQKYSKQSITLATLIITANVALAQSSATVKMTLHIPATTNAEKISLHQSNYNNLLINNKKPENTPFPKFRAFKACINTDGSIASNHSHKKALSSSDKRKTQAFHFDLIDYPADFTIDHAMSAVCQGSSTDIFHSISNNHQDPKRFRSPKDNNNQQTAILRLSPI